MWELVVKILATKCYRSVALWYHQQVSGTVDKNSNNKFRCLGQLGELLRKMEDDSSGCPLKESQGYFQTYPELLTQSLNMAFAFYQQFGITKAFLVFAKNERQHDDMVCSMGQKYFWMWGSSLRGSRGRVCWTMQPNFGTTVFLATVPCPFKISQNIPYSWRELGAHSKYPRLSKYSWLQLGSHPGDHLHDHSGAGLLEHRHSCRVKI